MIIPIIIHSAGDQSFWFDLMQAIGVLVALPAAVWGIINLFKKDKEKQKQINSLIKLAEESSSQTVILSGQLEKMTESNKIQTEYLELFGKYISAAEQSVELQKEQRELDLKKRKSEIKPRIKKDGATSSSTQSTIHIKNIGGYAKIKDIKIGPTNSVAIPGFEEMKRKELEPGIRNSIALKTSSKCPHMNDCIIDIIIYIEDKDSNIYELYIKGNARNPDVSDIIETDPTEN